MDDIKEKLLTATQDGAIDAAEVVEQLLMYIDADTVQDIIEKEGIKFARYVDDYEIFIYD